MEFNVGSDVFNQHTNNFSENRQSKKLSSNRNVATVVAKVVTASKFENNKLIPVGKYGFALAGDIKQNYYQILLYGSKNSILVNLILTKDFKYNVKENNIVEFLSKENWHLEFNNTNDAEDFNWHLAFVLWKLSGSKDLFWMDLYYSSRIDKIATFDSIVEITYVANTVQGKTFGPEVSNNINDDRYLKVRVCEEGWEKSLLGVNENTRRIVYIPVAKMGAWKILTDNCKCLCLTVTVKNVYEFKENNITDFLDIRQEPVNKEHKNNSSLIQANEIVDNFIIETIDTSKIVCIQSLNEELEKLKFDNIKTNERLTKLEAIIQEKKQEKIDNLGNVDLKKIMKRLYKSIIQEFPVDQSFSGSQIQTTMKDIFHNALMSSNQSYSNNDCIT